MTKKRHHYVPTAYLRPFCGDDGKLYIYRKDDPEKVIQQSPDSVAFHKHYYSQPLPGGGHDHDKLEDFFSKCETKWPGIVEQFRARKNVNSRLGDIFAFIALQRARVPAARDACEKILAETVKVVTRQMDAQGKLPPPPKGFEDILDHVDVAIDPHQSIHAMVPIIRGIGKLLCQIGICVAHNKTKVPFLTSDNPVIWFDPSLSESEMRPYAVRLGGPIMLLFPVAPDLMVYGDSSMQEYFGQHGLSYGEQTNVRAVKAINQYVCRFAYETVFASKPGFGELVKEHADVSPVIRTVTIPATKGQYILHQYVWGQRIRKPKWKRGDQ
ncbi:MAG: DUF4238 domain-containing protein [Phycisphaerae bacterium]|jgi:hypothetical protein